MNSGWKYLKQSWTAWSIIVKSTAFCSPFKWGRNFLIILPRCAFQQNNILSNKSLYHPPKPARKTTIMFSTSLSPSRSLRNENNYEKKTSLLLFSSHLFRSSKLIFSLKLFILYLSPTYNHAHPQLYSLLLHLLRSLIFILNFMYRKDFYLFYEW